MSTQIPFLDLLQVAEKYQTPTVVTWFENEVKYMKRLVFVKGDSHDIGDAEPSSFLQSYPLLALHCAILFGLVTCGRLALREFSRCDECLLTSTTESLPIHVYLRGVEIRRARTQVFRNFVMGLTEPKNERQKYIDSWGVEHESITPDKRRVCVHCSAERAAWVLKIENAVMKSPKWETFKVAYESAHHICEECSGPSWAEHYGSLLPSWRLEAEAMDHQLPEWPFTR